MVPTINGIVIGNLNGVSFSTTREKSPVYTMGNVDPVAFGRGKRGHAGSLIFTNFNKEALGEVKEKSLAKNDASQRLLYYRKTTDVPAAGKSILLEQTYEGDLSGLGGLELAKANYNDQLPPFTITLSSMNEHGSITVMAILGVELINEGSGVSIDDITTETQMTFVARAIIPWSPLDQASQIAAFDANVVSANSPIAAIRSAFAAQGR